MVSLRLQFSLHVLLGAFCLSFCLSGCSALPSFASWPFLFGDSNATVSRSEDTQIKLYYPAHPDIIVKGEGASAGVGVNLVRNTEFFSYPIHSGEITTMVVRRDGRGVFTASNDGRIALTSLAWPDGVSEESAPLSSAFVKSETVLTSPYPVLAMSLSPDERYLAVGQFSYVMVYDLNTRTKVAELHRLEGRVTSLAWDPTGQLLAIGRAGGDIYVWTVMEDGEVIAKDNLNFLERYIGGASPIVKIVFHPSSRVFFAAEREGVVALWRLLRTERQLGLRDYETVADQKQEISTRTVVATINAKLEDISVDAAAERFFAATSDGRLIAWKLRGLKSAFSIDGGPEAINSFTFLGGKSALVAANFRDQKIKFWCVPPIDFVYQHPQDPSLLTGGPVAVNKDAPDSYKSDMMLVAESPVFAAPAGLSGAGEKSRLLWVAQKTGNLLALDTGVSVPSSASCLMLLNKK